MTTFYRRSIVALLIASFACAAIYFAASWKASKKNPWQLDEEVVSPRSLTYDPRLEPIIIKNLPTNIRELEQNRRPIRPSYSSNKKYAKMYDSLLKDKQNGSDAVEPMPATSCSKVETVLMDENTKKAYTVHSDTVEHFNVAFGFGNFRMLWIHSPNVKRIELVSLLLESEPSVYLRGNSQTDYPTFKETRLAKRRPLDEFEQLSLDALRHGQNLVWSPEATKRMFGAIRATKSCLNCHVDAKEGELLGAFTYYLDTPVNEWPRQKRINEFSQTKE